MEIKVLTETGKVVEYEIAAEEVSDSAFSNLTSLKLNTNEDTNVEVIVKTNLPNETPVYVLTKDTEEYNVVTIAYVHDGEYGFQANTKETYYLSSMETDEQEYVSTNVVEPEVIEVNSHVIKISFIPSLILVIVFCFLLAQIPTIITKAIFKNRDEDSE